MGIESSVASMGKKAIYKGLPALDEAAAAGISVTEKGLEPALAVAANMRRAGSLALDIIDPQRENNRYIRQHFQGRVGAVALVGGFEDMSTKTAEATAESLWDGQIVDAATIVGVRPLINGEDAKQRSDLRYSAKLLIDSLVQNYNIPALLIAPEDPARIHGKSSTPRQRAFYEAIYQADDEFNTWLYDRLKEHGYEGEAEPRSRLVFIARPAVAEVLNGIEAGNLHNGGAAVLEAVRRRSQYAWRPLKRPTPPATNQPSQEIIEQPYQSISTDPDRENRFIRVYMNQTADQRERERQIGLSEG